MVALLIIGILIPFVSVLSYFVGFETLFYFLSGVTLLGSIFLAFGSGNIAGGLAYLVITAFIVLVAWDAMQPATIWKALLLGSSVSSCLAVIFFLKTANFSCGGN